LKRMRQSHHFCCAYGSTFTCAVSCLSPHSDIKTPNSLQNLEPSEPYDIIFIDAQKTGYPSYLATILRLSQTGAATRLLRPGGLIIADNVLRCGFAADDSEDNPWRNYDFGPHRKEYWKSADVQSVKAYNQMILESQRVENWLCPLWDGVNISRLLD
jgi:predicted O-methyltransferase YrrM